MKSKGIYIVVFFYLLTSFFLTYVNLDFELMSKVSRVFVVLLIIYLLLNIKEIRKKKKDFFSYNYVLYFLLSPILTHIACFISHGQSIISSFSVSAASLVLCIYLFCILKGTKPESIVKLILILAIARTTITLIQQFTYPDVLFTFSQDKFDNYGTFREIEERSGFRRFLIADAYYLPVFMGFYGIKNFLQKKEWAYFVFFLFAFFGLYMDQSRQIIFVFLLCLLLTPFLAEKRNGTKQVLFGVFFVLLLGGILYLNYDTLFGELGEKTSEQLNDDYTRSVEIAYFISKMGGPLTVLFGNGWFGNSSYGKEYRYMQDTVAMYREDVGIIGAAHMVGIVFCIVFLIFIIKMLRKNWRYLSIEYKYMFLFILFDTPLIFPIYNYTFASIECFMGMLIYLADKSIQENKSRQIAISNETKFRH